MCVEFDMFFKELLMRVVPANKSLNYMEVKELSEIMEAARAAAYPHVMAYLKAANAHEKVSLAYYAQCQKARKY